MNPGERLGPYEILGRIGAGGMGEVFRARHTRLRREVAIKILPPSLAGDERHLARFEREARAASALNHPNIVTIHDIAESEGTTYIAMELVDGTTLRERIAHGPMPIGDVVRIGVQLADGLARAHGAGLVHRDLKAANVMLTRDGRVKILDFGLAKPIAAEPPADRSRLDATREGVIVGTPHYMSPEQASGDAIDQRSDLFSFGVLLHEMLTGKLPFDGPSLQAVLAAVMTLEAPPVRSLRPDAPHALETLVAGCLEKRPADRVQSADEVLRQLQRLASPVPSLSAMLARPRVAIPLAAVVLASVLGATWWTRGAERRWAGTRALAETAALADSGMIYDAFRTLTVARQYRGDDPALQPLLERVTFPMQIASQPAGAEVQVRRYASQEDWMPIGRTPLAIRIPYAMMDWRIVKDGYEPFEGAPFGGSAFAALRGGMPLDSLGRRPPGMVRVPETAPSGLPFAVPSPGATLPSYYLDKFEVTNRQYQEFVTAGGYQSREHWAAAQQEADTAFDPAVTFTDRSGRPGPAQWELGRHDPALADHPVAGVSWFEAAAFCAWAGKRLPTIYHWFAAIGQEQLSDILRFSNIRGRGPTPVGASGGMTAYGALDMAGNVKEWTHNRTGTRRFTLGGAWNEPGMFRAPDSADPWARAESHGFRCARYGAVADTLLAPVTLQAVRVPGAPLSASAFELLRGFYAYERQTLDARVERVNDSVPAYRHEIVSVRTAYGDGRMRINLLMPRDFAPPWQAVIWFPGADVFGLRDSPAFSSAFLFDFLPRAGRVVVYPTYDGMHERFRPREQSTAALRENLVRWARDLGRAIDYLETRPDVDASRIAYYGFSGGANYGPIFLAVEPRLKAAVLMGAGLNRAPWSPDNHPMLLAPHAKAATLFLNGHDDFVLPYETSQRPLFEAIGVPDSMKRLVRVRGGHIPESRHEVMREVLAWLDRWLGPVPDQSQTVLSGSYERRR